MDGIYYEDYLKKESSKGKWQKYWVRLDKTGLSFYHSELETEAIEVINIAVNTRCVPTKRQTYSFRFLLLAENGSYALKCNSPIDRYRWIYMIDLAANGKPMETPPYYIPASYYRDKNSNTTPEVSNTVKKMVACENGPEFHRKEDSTLQGKLPTRGFSRKSRTFFRRLSSGRKKKSKKLEDASCEITSSQAGDVAQSNCGNNNSEGSFDRQRDDVNIFKDTPAPQPKRTFVEESEYVPEKPIAAKRADPAAIAEVYSKLRKANGVLEKLTARAAQRQARLQNALLCAQEFQESFDDFLEKLSRLEEQTARQEPVSGIYETVKRQNQQHKPIRDSVHDLGPVHEQLVRSARNILETSEPEPEMKTLEEKLHGATDRWHEIKRKTADRQDQLEQVIQLARKYRDDKNNAQAWLIEAERKLQRIETDNYDRPTLEEMSTALSKQKEAIDSHRADFDRLNETSPVLVDNCTADKDVIDGETQGFNKRYGKLADDAAAMEKKLENLKQAVEDYGNATQSTERTMAKYKNLLVPRVPLGIDLNQGKEDVNDLQMLQLLLTADEQEIHEAKNAGAALLSLLNENSPAAALVNYEMQSASARYKDLSDALTKREARLNKDMSQARKFHDALYDLEQWLPRVEVAVSTQEPISSDPGVIERQLSRAEVLCDNIVKFKVNLEILEETGQEIIEDSSEDPKVVQDVREAIEKITSLVDILARKICDRQTRLQNALIQCQEFQVSYDDFMYKLGSIEEALDKQEPISALYRTLARQREEVGRLNDTLDEKQSLYEKLVQTGLAIAQTLEDEPERESLERKIGIMKKRWDDAKRNVRKRLERFFTTEPLAKTFYDEAQGFSAALSDIEQIVEAFESLSISKNAIVKQKEILEQIREEARKLEPKVGKTETAAADLKHEAERDVDAVQAEVDEFVAGYARLETSLLQRGEELQALEEASDRYHATVQQVENLFDLAYDVVDAAQTFGTDTDKATEKLADIQERNTILTEKEPEVNEVGLTGETLMEKIHEDSADRLLITDKVSEVSYRFDDLRDRLQERELELQEEIDKSKEFTENVAELNAWLDIAQEKLASQGPISTDPAAVQKQLREIQNLRVKHDGYKSTLDTIQDVGEWLTDWNREAASVANMIQQESDQLERRYNDVKVSLLQLEGDLQAAQMRTQEFQGAFDDFIGTLREMEGLAAKLEPVSAVWNTVRLQKKKDEELTDKVKKHEPVFEQLMKRGEKVLQSTESGYERDELHRKLDDVKKRWDDVKRTSYDHMSLVNSIVDDADKYQDAAEYLSPWLSSLQDQVASLEIIVAVHETVTAREAVLGTLREDIDRHRPDRVTIDEKSKAVIGLAQVDQELVETEAQKLMDRYDKLDTTCAIKQQELERVLNAMEKYRTALKPVKQILEEGDALISCLGPISGDLTKLRNELQALKAMQQTLRDARDDVNSLNDCGEEVTATVLAAAGDSSPVKEELTAVNQRYNELQGKLKARKDEAEKALDRGSELRDTLEKIKSWALETLANVEAWAPVSTDPASALHQLHELEAIENDMTQYNQDFDRATHTVMEITHAGVESAVESELNSLLSQARDLLDKISENLDGRKNKLQAVIAQSGEFEKYLDEFLLWLTKTERTVTKLRPASADADVVKQQKDEYQIIHEKIKEKENAYTALMEAGEKLKESSELPADRKSLEEKLSDVTFGWIELNAKSDDRSAVLSRAAVATFEHHNLCCHLFPWLAGVEKKADEILLSCDPDAFESCKENLEGLTRDIESHTCAYDDLNKTARVIIEICVDAVDEVKNDIHDINERWKKLKKKLTDTDSKLRSLQKQLQVYRNALSTVDNNISEVEKVVVDDEPLVLDTQELKAEVDRLRAAKSKLESLGADVGVTIASGQDILDTNQDLDTTAVQRDDKVLQDYHDEVERKLGEKLDRTGKLLDELEEYWTKEKEMEQEMEDAREKLEQGKPREIDMEKIKEQLENTKMLKNRLEEQLLYDGVKNSFANLIGQGRDPHSVLAKQMTDTRKQWNDVEDAVANQIKELEAVLEQLENWHEAAKESDQALTAVESKAADRVTVDTDADSIKEQIEQVKSLRSETNKVKENISTLTDITYKIHVAHPDAEKCAIEKTVEELKKRLARLAALLFDRLQKLELALKQFKKPKKPKTEGQQLHAEIVRLCRMCTCDEKFPYSRVDDSKYKLGDSQKIRLVRIMRTTVMVRVGGGWETLQQFLSKHDPCRADHRANEGQDKGALKPKQPSATHEASEVNKPPIARDKSSGSLGKARSSLDGPRSSREKSPDLRSPRGTKKQNDSRKLTPIAINRSKSEASIKSDRSAPKSPASPRKRSSGIPLSPQMASNRRLSLGSPQNSSNSHEGTKGSG